uniref:CSON010578 protein n=1 Tax=Culicoides sonorensis TaxID=179676 RepID=A0A336KHH4_CULSO
MHKIGLWLFGALILTVIENAVSRRENPKQRKEIPLGAIFEEDDTESEVAFRCAIEWQNMQTRDYEFVPIIKHVSSMDSYKAGQIACEMASQGVAAIFGPSSPFTSGIVSSIANTLEIPHIVTHWTPVTPNQEHHRMTINMYPDSEVLSSAILDLVTDYDWKQFTIIYDDDSGLIHLKDVLSAHGPEDQPIIVRKLDDEEDQRPVLKALQDMGESHIILAVNTERVIELLRQAAEVKLFGDYVSFIIADLDIHTIDFEEITHSGTNITAMRLIHTDNDELMYMTQLWKQRDRGLRIQGVNNYTMSGIFNDAVKIFVSAFMDIDSTEEIEIAQLSCDEPEPWQQGNSITSFLKRKEGEGVTGKIGFNEYGERTLFNLEIIELGKDGFKTIGTWDPLNKVEYTRTEGDVTAQVVESLQNKTFIVSSRIGKPFLMMREPEEGEILEGNARYEGYSMDLIKEVARVLGFKFRFELAPDGKYGGYNKVTKKWDGLIKQLLDRKADLAICDLTITQQRRSAVDFTMPFMTLGISILYKKPIKEPPSLFSFLLPLSSDVWLYTCTAYLGISLLLFALARMAANDWENPHPCKDDNEELENIWGLMNCTWLTMGSIMGQGCDILPKSASTRLVAGMWWFFALIMLSSYTANLAAFLTNERMDSSINGAEDLSKQSKVKCGVVDGGSTAAFFRDSNFSTYQRIWASMESAKPSVFVKSNDEGKERVKKGDYAFFMESTTLEYLTERDCELTQLGGLLDSKGYGIALPLNSPYRTAISQAVIKLQEEGKLLTIKDKWWKIDDGCSKKESGDSGDSDAAELSIGAVGGVFLVLGCGIGCAFVIGILEFLWNVRKIAVESKIPQSQALKSELLFALNFWITNKPVNPVESEAPEEEEDEEDRDENYDCSKAYSRQCAIFPPILTQTEIAFRAALRRANLNTHGFELVPSIKYVADTDSFKAEIAACELLEEGVAAIFGPSSNLTSGIVDSICNTFQIPHIMGHWTYDRMRYHYSSSKKQPQPRYMTINVYPDSDVLSAALADLIRDYDWKSYTIVYDNDDNLIRLKDVLGLHGPKDPPCTIVQLDHGNDYRPALKKIYFSTEPHIILSVDAHRIVDILHQAREVQLGIITSNITALRLLDPTSDDVDNVASFMRNEQKQLGQITYLTKEEYMKKMQQESVIYFDAVQLLAQSIDDLNEDEPIFTQSLTCQEFRQWPDGFKIASYMKRKEIEGISGKLLFDERGHRRDFRLEIIELSQKKDNGHNSVENGFKRIGTWDAQNKITYTRTEGELMEQLEVSLQNKTFIVASRIGAPFLTFRKPEDGEILEGNARFEGYSLDLIDSIARHLGFQYRMELVPDGKYGGYNKKTKKWDGLVKQLLDRKADLAICDLTITHERRTAVDFTMPFMTLGISILYSKPVKQPPAMFSFLQPLSTDVWICTAAAYLGVSILTFILARMANAEWEDPHPCNPSEEKENIWGMLNCTWLTMGSVMGQGSDILPKANSTRLVTGMWYFFALIMLASYTANLAAFLTMERMEASINNAEELSQQTKIKYGVLEGGSSAAFFRDSNHSTYKRMWAAMESAQPSVFTKSNDEGRDRVLNGKGNYAYLMESTTLEYIIERNCSLTQIGNWLDSKGYGIAMPRGKCQADSTAAAGSAAELGIANVGGVFLLVGLGILTGFIIAFFEFMWNVRKIAVEEKMTQWEAFVQEIKFAIKVNVTSKPVQKSTSEISSIGRSKRSRSSTLE